MKSVVPAAQPEGSATLGAAASGGSSLSVCMHRARVSLGVVAATLLGLCTSYVLFLGGLLLDDALFGGRLLRPAYRWFFHLVTEGRDPSDPSAAEGFGAAVAFSIVPVAWVAGLCIGILMLLAGYRIWRRRSLPAA